MRRVRFAALAACLFSALLATGAQAKTYYLDGQLNGNCSGNYSIANRACNGGDGDAYSSMTAALNAMVPSDTLIIRPGQYWQSDDAALAVENGRGGSPGNPTIVTTLPGEERLAVLCSAAGKCQRNPEPACGGGGTGCSTGNQYHPYPAISIGDPWVEVRNMKTFGQACMLSTNIVLENSDIEGGGPSRCVQAGNQGMVVAYKHTNSTTIVRNNRIHWSTRGDTSGNGACVMGYDGNLLLENNTIYDCWENGIRFKDQLPAPSIDPSIVRRNAFLRNSQTYVNAGGRSNGGGISGCTQNCDGIGQHRYHDNLFVDTEIAIGHDQFGPSPLLVYNNTFISMGNYNIGWWNGPDRPVHAFNNLFHSNESTKVISNVTATSLHNFNYNCYSEASGGSLSWVTSTGTYVSLGQWQNAGQDSSGTNVAPDFVNAGCLSSGNCQAADFKRNSFAESMNGSPYGLRCGPYQTNNETIGADWSVAAPVCGNGVAEGSEVCDGNDFGGQTCASLGFSQGTLSCQSDCAAFDTSGCSHSPLPAVNNVRFIN